MNGRAAALTLGVALAAFWTIENRALAFVPALALYFGCAAIWLYAVREIVRGAYRPGFGEALAFAVGLRLIVLPLAPSLSDDIYRYLFEGRMLLDGSSPYVHAPVSAAAAHLRDASWELINNKSIAAAYPPAVQVVNAAGAATGLGVIAIKACYATFDVLTFVMLWRWLPSVGVACERALIHGLCPLPILEFAVEGHSDSLAICAIVAALLAIARGRAGWAGAALGIATLGKWMPIVFLPFALRAVRERARLVAGFFVVCGVFAAPFLWIGDFSFDGTMQYVVRWRGNDSAFGVILAGFEWVRATGIFGQFEPQALAKIPILLLGIGLLAYAWRVRAPLERTMGWFFVFFIAFAPTVHPWYVTFLLPWLCVRPNPGLLVFVGTVFLAYHVLPAWVLERRWVENGWIKSVEYLPFYAAAYFAGNSLRKKAHIAARSSTGT